MKKYTILFALLTGMILLAFEAVPALQVSAQSQCGGKGQPACPPSNPGSSGGPEKPGPKNHPTPVPPPPTLVAGPTLVMSLPTIPIMMPIIPSPTPYPYPHIPDQNLCRVGPCGPLSSYFPGDPVEYLAGGGFLVFLIVIGFVFFRGRNAQGGGGNSSIR